MLKAADALSQAGYQVRVVSVSNSNSPTSLDEDARVRRQGLWQSTLVEYSPVNGRLLYVKSSLRQRLYRRIASHLTSQAIPFGVAARAYSRVYPELLRRAVSEPADLFYGGARAIAEVAAASRLTGVPYGLDLEDFHSAEQEPSAASCLTHSLASRLEREVIPSSNFLTAAGSAIAAEYESTYGVRPISINNTFMLPSETPPLNPSEGDRLRLYWYSQTIGPFRGLEDAVFAIAFAGIDATLTLRGKPIPAYLDELRHLASRVAPRLAIEVCDPGPPERMVELARGYDVGLALEQPTVRNREICLTNKALTYPLAGLAVAFTDTPGQRQLAVDLGEGAILYRPGDFRSLGTELRRWAFDKPSLGRAKKAAWNAGSRRWHWEHEEERGALLRVIDRSLSFAPKQRAASGGRLVEGVA
jgi:hypothetical protein